MRHSAAHNQTPPEKSWIHYWAVNINLCLKVSMHLQSGVPIIPTTLILCVCVWCDENQTTLLQNNIWIFVLMINLLLSGEHTYGSVNIWFFFGCFLFILTSVKVSYFWILNYFWHNWYSSAKIVFLSQTPFFSPGSRWVSIQNLFIPSWLFIPSPVLKCL